jgi:hypothetical protein
MILWKTIAITLAIILGVSYGGFVYIYIQSGGITTAGIITGGLRPKVMSLLKNSNVTNLNSAPSWNTSVDIFGYKTGFLYCQIYQHGNPTPIITPTLYLMVEFETDGMLGIFSATGAVKIYENGSASSSAINLMGSRMWIGASANYQWAVMSMSLYLRD